MSELICFHGPPRFFLTQSTASPKMSLILAQAFLAPLQIVFKAPMMWGPIASQAFFKCLEIQSIATPMAFLIWSQYLITRITTTTRAAITKPHGLANMSLLSTAIALPTLPTMVLKRGPILPKTVKRTLPKEVMRGRTPAKMLAKVEICPAVSATFSLTPGRMETIAAAVLTPPAASIPLPTAGVIRLLALAR